MLASAFYSMKLGSDVINDPYYTLDKKKNGTLLNIKWYHFLWLFIPIQIYLSIILNQIYRVGHTLVTFVLNFKFLGIFELRTESKGNAFDMAWGNLIIIAISFMLIFHMLKYLRKVVLGETSQHWALKILIIIGIGFVIPFLIIMYTTLAG